MNARIATRAALAALFLTASSAAAGDLPIRYKVEEKPLKEAVSGTMLTFSLYSDSLCTDLVATQSLAIDSLSISKLKLFAPAGGAKPPKTAVIEASLGVPAAASYLKVTGTGITAVGGECQPQSTGTTGKTVSVSTIGGAGGSATLPSGDYAFFGNPATVSLTAAQIVAGSARAFVTASGTLEYDLCYQPNAGGALTAFSPGGPEVAASRNLTAIGAVAPGAGLWKIGFCLGKHDAVSPVTVLEVNGWIAVMQ